MVQASPHPMVMMTSAPRVASSVRGLGNSRDRSSPTSAMAASTAGLMVSAGADPALGVSVQQSRRHLRAAGIVDAHEQDGGDLGSFGPCALDHGRLRGGHRGLTPSTSMRPWRLSDIRWGTTTSSADSSTLG